MTKAVTQIAATITSIQSIIDVQSDCIDQLHLANQQRQLEQIVEKAYRLHVAIILGDYATIYQLAFVHLGYIQQALPMPLLCQL